MARATIFGGILGMVLATSAAYVLGSQLTLLMLEMATARAIDQLQLGILSPVRAEDFEPPYSTARLDDLNARLAPVFARVTDPGSGVARVNVIGPDGTILFSNEPSIRGKLVPPSEKPELTTALSGAIGVSRHSSLSTVENEDLRAHSADAIEVYVPIAFDGRTVGAYEIYQDSGSIRSLLVWLWVITVLTSACLFHAVTRWATAAGRAPITARVPYAPYLVESRPPAVRLGSEPSRSLTHRELEVLRLMATREGNRDIAEELVVSEETVRTHVKNVLRKLNQPSRTRAVVAAIAAGILEMPEPAAPSEDTPTPAPPDRTPPFG